MNDELTFLREENERLKLINNLLADKLREYENAALLSTAPSDKGKWQVHPSIASKQEGNMQVQPSSAASHGGNMRTPPFHRASDGGMERAASFHTAADGGTSTFDSSVIEHEIRHIMLRCTYTTSRNVVKILLKLHESPHHSHKALQGITGLSGSGMAKHVMALKRNGLIARTSFQHYALTEKALDILKKAMVKSSE